MSRLSGDQIALPAHLPVPDGAIVFWVIWDRPDDFPHGYVLRAQFAMGSETIASPVAWYADDPDKLRAILPQCLWKFPRQPDDPPHLLETWMA